MSSKTLEHIYHPRGACREVFSRREPEVLISGPAGTGKSRAALEKIHLACLLTPNTRALMVRKTLASFTSTGLVTWRRFVAKEAMEAGQVTWYGGSAQEAAQYRYSNGSTVTVGGLDKATRIMSSEYDLIFVQEATELTIDDWESLTTRLRNNQLSYQQLIADCNPSTPTHWLKARCDARKTVMLQSRHEDNPLLFDDDGVMTEFGERYIAQLEGLSGARYERLRHGRWTSAEGIIYEEFDPAVHVVRPFRIPWDWQRAWSIDFGYTNPFVCQFWAIDPDGRLYLYREIYKTKRLVEQHARDIINLVTRSDGSWKEPKPIDIVTDHDVEGRGTLEKHLGMSTTPVDKQITIEEGIQAAQSRMKVQPDGRPRIFFLKDAVAQQDEEMLDAHLPTSTIEEVAGYIWAPTPDGKEQKEVPLKKDDHGMDAMRYRIITTDLGARPRVRWL